MKATAIAHPIQGLIKYHGLKDPKLRLPFHDSISVCVDALSTTTTVEASKRLKQDSLVINRSACTGNDLERAKTVLTKLKEMARYSGHFKIVSENSVTRGKGLGFSASAFAALGTAACAALRFEVQPVELSELVRLGAGSATRSLAGGFAIWYASKGGRSFAEPIVSSRSMNLGMVVVPIPSPIRTDEAHSEVLSSPLFLARLRHVKEMVTAMRKAIQRGDVATIGRLAEDDTLNLHAITMTGRTRLVLWEPETVRIMKEVQRMRDEGVPVWYSMDTGPSVFVNTPVDCIEKVASRMRKLGCENVITSGVGGKPSLVNEHLF